MYLTVRFGCKAIHPSLTYHIFKVRSIDTFFCVFFVCVSSSETTTDRFANLCL